MLLLSQVCKLIYQSQFGGQDNLLVVLVKIVPHGGDHPGNFSETYVRILVLDGDLGITEEETVARNGSERLKMKH